LYGKPVPAPSRVSKRAVEKSSKLKADEAYELELAQQEAARFAHVNKLREAAAAVKAEAKKKKKITKTTTFGGEGMTYLPASANGASTSNKVRITEQAQFCFNHTSYLMISKASPLPPLPPLPPLRSSTPLPLERFPKLALHCWSFVATKRARVTLTLKTLFATT
jgi:hypothetical protein